jgi:hypothetical protein
MVSLFDFRSIDAEQANLGIVRQEERIAVDHEGYAVANVGFQLGGGGRPAGLLPCSNQQDRGDGNWKKKSRPEAATVGVRLSSH